MNTKKVTVYAVALSILIGLLIMMFREPASAPPTSLLNDGYMEKPVTYAELSSLRNELNDLRNQIGVLGNNTSDPNHPAGSGPGEELTGMSQRIELLERSFAEEQEEAGQEYGESQPSRAGNQVDATEFDIDQSAEQRAAEEEQRTELIVSHLENHLRSGPSDDIWTSTVMNSLEEAVQDGTVDRLVSTECQTDFCRLEVNHDNTEAVDEFLSRVVELEMFQDSEAFYRIVHQADGSEQTVLYIAHQGQRLPSLDID